MQEPDRRRFLKTCVAGAVLAVKVRPAAFSLFAPKQRDKPAATSKSRVVVARDAQLRGVGTTPDSTRLLTMLDRAMQTTYATDSPMEAWRNVGRPGQVVGLKVNCLAGRGISTNVLLAELICERLQQAGISKKDIVIWDRLSADLERAGYHVSSQADRIRCIGNDALGYEEDLTIYGSVGSRLSKALTQVCDVIISLPVLKDHGIVGVTMAMKNLFGAIHNPNKYHLDTGNPYVADLNAVPAIRKKVRLHICDALTAQYEGGPSFMPQWTWPYNGLLVSSDAVALDYVGWQIIERKRAEKGIKALREVKREPTYIATAADAQHQLGTNDPKRIEQVEV